MRAVKSKDTTPEMRVRRLAHALGYRYRLHCRDVAGTPDLVFGRRRMVVFVHGCFWHGHGCPRGARAPKTNADYWAGKIRRNRERDAANLAALAADGWRALVVWECETRDAGALPERLRGFLGAPRAPGRAR